MPWRETDSRKFDSGFRLFLCAELCMFSMSLCWCSALPGLLVCLSGLLASCSTENRNEQKADNVFSYWTAKVCIKCFSSSAAKTTLSVWMCETIPTDFEPSGDLHVCVHTNSIFFMLTPLCGRWCFIDIIPRSAQHGGNVHSAIGALVQMTTNVKSDSRWTNWNEMFQVSNDRSYRSFQSHLTPRRRRITVLLHPNSSVVC